MSEYLHTSWMIVDTEGIQAIAGEVRDLCYPLRLHRADDPIKIGDDIYIYSGGNYGKIKEYKISIGKEYSKK
jgi:hypothetical protein